MPDTVLVEIAAGGVATLSLNRPERRNAMNAAMGDALSAAVDRLNADAAVRAVVLRGAGDGFSAGGDFSLFQEFGAGSETDSRETMIAFYRRYLHVRDLRVPSIAAVHGAAIGAGACLAAACDLRVVALDAKIGFTFTRLGIHPGMAGSLLLPRLVGCARALELLATGRTIDGVEAERIGFAQRAVPAGDLVAAARALAAEIAAAAPIAVRLLKAGLREEGEDEAFGRALRAEADAQAACFRTEDFREGIAAVLGKRAPRFSGR